jgi:MFS family permease
MQGVRGVASSLPGRVTAGDAPVLGIRQFRLLWLAQIFAHTAQNATLFTLLVLVVGETGSTIHGSLLVLSYVFPSVVFGLVAGLLVDRWRKRTVLMTTSVLRVGACVAFLLVSPNVWLIYAINLGFSTMGQFFTTADAASIPALVPRRQLMAANSLFNLAVTGSQFGGMVLLAPVLIKSFGSDIVFVAAALAFLVATVLARRLPEIEDEESPEVVERGRPLLRGAVWELWSTLRLLRHDAASNIALLQMTVSSSLVLFFAVLVPRYMQSVLQVAPDDAVFIFAPTGVGALLGLRALPWATRRLGKGRVVVVGLVGLALCLAALGFVERIADVMENTERLNPFASNGRVAGLSVLVALTMALTGPLGFAYALVNAPAQTILHERAPAEMRGRVFASQLVLANVVSIGPLMLVGGVADLYGVSPVLLSIAVVVLLTAAISVFQGGRERTARRLAEARSSAGGGAVRSLGRRPRLPLRDGAISMSADKGSKDT